MKQGFCMRDFLALDVETTGLNPLTDYPIALGYALVRDGWLVGSGEFLINWDVPIPPVATAIHGIDEPMCAAAGISPQVAARRLEQLLGMYGPHVVGHNLVRFDLGFLRKLARLDSLLGLTCQFHDTLAAEIAIAQGLRAPYRGTSEQFSQTLLAIPGAMKGNGLAEVCERRGIVLARNSFHNAGEDARACAEIVLDMVRTGEWPYEPAMRELVKEMQAPQRVDALGRVSPPARLDEASDDAEADCGPVPQGPAVPQNSKDPAAVARSYVPKWNGVGPPPLRGVVQPEGPLPGLPGSAGAPLVRTGQGDYEELYPPAAGRP